MRRWRAVHRRAGLVGGLGRNPPQEKTCFCDVGCVFCAAPLGLAGALSGVVRAGKIVERCSASLDAEVGCCFLLGCNWGGLVFS